MTRRPAWVLIAGLTLMTVALAWFTPFGAFPDELDHYERALSIGDGELVGQANPEPSHEVTKKTCCAPGNPTAVAWVGRGVRLVHVDTDQRPEQLRCTQVVTSSRLGCGRAPAPGAQINAMGTIEPVAYAPGGLVANIARSPTVAFRLTRLVPACLSLVLIAMTVLALQRRFRNPATIAAVVATMSVGTLAVVASGSPNALEIGGAICFLAGALALTDIGHMPRADWWCLGAGGFALTTSRSLGPIWLVVLAAVASAVGSWRCVAEHVRAHRAAALMVSAVVASGMLFTVAWEAQVQPHVPVDFAFLVKQIGPSFGDGAFASRQFVAGVGSLPEVVFAWMWGALAFGLVVGGLVVGSARARRGIAAAGLLLVATFVGLSAAVLRQNGFGIQARHVLPIVGALLIAGGLAWRDRTPPAWVALTAGALAAGVLTVAWGYLRASYAPSPNGLVMTPVTVRDAAHALRSLPTLMFVAGAVLAGGAIPLSAALAARGEQPEPGPTD